MHSHSVSVTRYHFRQKAYIKHARIIMESLVSSLVFAYLHLPVVMLESVQLFRACSGLPSLRLPWAFWGGFSKGPRALLRSVCPRKGGWTSSAWRREGLRWTFAAVYEYLKGAVKKREACSSQCCPVTGREAQTEIAEILFKQKEGKLFHLRAG